MFQRHFKHGFFEEQLERSNNVCVEQIFDSFPFPVEG